MGEGGKAAVEDCSLSDTKLQHDLHCITWTDDPSEQMTKLPSEANGLWLGLISHFSLDWQCDKDPVKLNGDVVFCSDRYSEGTSMFMNYIVIGYSMSY